ncbi:MAG: 50S ribosomal protein L9 [Puniceicoccales bacterium]|jgi:large subunit ribosomal protein L9|nr:50S ribosomal protein L9 [Puniceicoccales bacterium]
MALSEVLLLKPVNNLGAEGDQVKVRSGYARNFLLPQGTALPVSRANRKHVESLKKARAAREAKELESAQAVAAKLADVKLVFAVKTGEGGKMFGAVTVAEILAKLAEQGIDLDKKKVHLPHGSVKGLGVHTAQIKLHAEITHGLDFEVISENPIEEPPAETEVNDDDNDNDFAASGKSGAKKRLAKGAPRKKADAHGANSPTAA